MSLFFENTNYIVSKCQNHSFYNIIVDNGSELFRVNVRSVKVKDEVMRHNRYKVNVTTSKDSFDSSEIDVLAVYIIPENVWYFIPGNLIHGMKTVTLKPHISDKCVYKEFISLKVFGWIFVI